MRRRIFVTGPAIYLVTFGAPKPLWGRKTKKYIASCLAYCFQYAHVNDFVPVCIPLPGYRMVNKVKVGKDFCILKYFKTGEYHCSYGDKSLYNSWDNNAIKELSRSKKFLLFIA